MKDLKKIVNKNVQADDLIQSGMIGLLEASKNYNPGQGASFETYAGIRIRGAMLDEIRRGDWAPRSLHRKMRQVTQAALALGIAWLALALLPRGQAAAAVATHAAQFASLRCL